MKKLKNRSNFYTTLFTLVLVTILTVLSGTDILAYRKTKKGKIDYMGHRYEGEYIEVKRGGKIIHTPHGKGIIYYDNGDTYSSDFIKGKPYGTGFMNFENGSRCVCTSKKGEIIPGYGIILYPDYKYKGGVEFDRRLLPERKLIKHGRGKVIYFNNDHCFTAKFSHGKLDTIISNQASSSSSSDDEE